MSAHIGKVGRTGNHQVVLLTGFGPFPGVPVNFSGSFVEAISRRAQKDLPHVRIVESILPTQWQRAPEIVAQLHAEHRPSLALHFGVAADARGLRLETRARNLCRPADDALGLGPASATLDASGVSLRVASIDVEGIAARLSRPGPAISVSDDAGGYICNAVFYHSLAASEGCGCKVGFVHIPRDLHARSPDFSRAIEDVIEIIRYSTAGGEAKPA